MNLNLSATDWQALLLTLKLAGMTTLLLALLGIPLSWWLANRRGRLRPLLEVVLSLPLVLPPTVLGFYLLLLLSPNQPLGALWQQLFNRPLVFSFPGLVAASMLYSLPFMVQPLLAAFDQRALPLAQAAAGLGMPPLARLRSVVLPACRSALVVALSMTFAHTLGEFGVVLMIGGAIPGETQVVSVALYQHVENLDYGGAHRLALVLLLLSVLLLLLGRYWGGRLSGVLLPSRKSPVESALEARP
ncbi:MULTISPECIES: molybdate ABC transporter permease subunit [unclassified Microbulbifer]|uniref:molybdate ABC transporter permease subunit n=1 Tax=unclassified Microbulbifer TaxID=2619833 RepID=UPI0027E45F3A|nr:MULTISPECIES: molybdate ABC transporter permease subunit [unclassified Microbulbifer]